MQYFPDLQSNEQIWLERTKRAIFGSSQTPATLVLKAHDWAKVARDSENLPLLLGGWHTAIEQECLTVLLKGTCPIVICLARSLEFYRVPSIYRSAIQAGRLFLISAFPSHVRRITASTAQARNQFILAIADELMFLHAAPNSRTYQLAIQAKSLGKPILTLDHPANAPLIGLGAAIVKVPS